MHLKYCPPKSEWYFSLPYLNGYNKKHLFKKNQGLINSESHEEVYVKAKRRTHIYLIKKKEKERERAKKKKRNVPARCVLPNSRPLGSAAGAALRPPAARWGQELRCCPPLKGPRSAPPGCLRVLCNDLKKKTANPPGSFPRGEGRDRTFRKNPEGRQKSQIPRTSPQRGRSALPRAATAAPAAADAAEELSSAPGWVGVHAAAGPLGTADSSPNPARPPARLPRAERPRCLPSRMRRERLGHTTCPHTSPASKEFHRRT